MIEEESLLERRGLRLVLIGAFLTIVVGGVVDIVLDAPERWLSAHVLVEAILVTMSLGLALYLWRGWQRSERSLAAARKSLEERRRERDEWRESARTFLEGLGEAIDRQFDEWELTRSEREVALLLVKGYSHKQIAAMTDRSERTVRQHASSAYAKAGLAGRAELAGFFLDGLMLPRGSDPGDHASGGGAAEEPGEERAPGPMTGTHRKETG